MLRFIIITIIHFFQDEFKVEEERWKMNFGYILLLASAGGLLALGLAFFKTLWIFKQPVENEKLKRISGYVAEGAMAFLAREYSVLLPFVLVVAVLLAVANRGFLRLQALSFSAGALCSALTGFIGMKVATAANSRTTHAAQGGLNKALKVAFSEIGRASCRERV